MHSGSAFIRGTDTVLFSHGESLSSPCTFAFDRKRLHQHRRHVCLLSSGTTLHLAGCCAARHVGFEAEDAASLAEGPALGGAWKMFNNRAWMSTILSSAAAAAHLDLQSQRVYVSSQHCPKCCHVDCLPLRWTHHLNKMGCSRCFLRARLIKIVLL